MIVDLQSFVLDLEQKGHKKIKQKELCEIINVNRYTVSMIFNKWDGIYRNMKPDSAYRLNRAYPDYFELPEDFCYYSVASFAITAKMEEKDMATIAKKLGISQHTLGSKLNRGTNYFIYDEKDYFGQFKTIYIPMLNGEVASKKPEKLSYEEFEKRVMEKLDKVDLGSKCTKEEYLAGSVMYGLGQHNMVKLCHHIKDTTNATDEQMYGLLCSCFDDHYDVMKVVRED